MDVLSELLSGLRFKGPVYLQPPFEAPWSARVTASERAMARLHLVLHGNCWIGVPGQGPFVQLEAGDFAFVPHGEEHFLRDHPDRPPMDDHPIPVDTLPASGLLSLQPVVDVSRLQCQLICGYFRLDGVSSHPLLARLPSLLSVRRAALGAHAPLLPLVDFALRQRGGAPGAELMQQRAAELLLIEAVALWAGSLAADQGFIAARADTRIGRALTTIHTDYRQDWTVTTLARHAGLSRTAFTLRFKELVGQPPMTYLANRRLMVAQRLLSDNDAPLDRVAAAIGFRSTAAFARAFRRTHDVSPGNYRAR